MKAHFENEITFWKWKHILTVQVVRLIILKLLWNPYAVFVLNICLSHGKWTPGLHHIQNVVYNLFTELQGISHLWACYLASTWLLLRSFFRIVNFPSFFPALSITLFFKSLATSNKRLIDCPVPKSNDYILIYFT